jgi:hypothetical protein
MKQGWLWYDNDPKKPLDEKLTEAALRYKQKFGIEPTVCYVNPAHLDSKGSSKGKVKLISASTVMPNYFWLEIDK